MLAELPIGFGFILALPKPVLVLINCALLDKAFETLLTISGRQGLFVETKTNETT